jgi:hypothetical protein
VRDIVRWVKMLFQPTNTKIAKEVDFIWHSDLYVRAVLQELAISALPMNQVDLQNALDQKRLPAMPPLMDLLSIVRGKKVITIDAKGIINLTPEWQEAISRQMTSTPYHGIEPVSAIDQEPKEDDVTTALRMPVITNQPDTSLASLDEMVTGLEKGETPKNIRTLKGLLSFFADWMDKTYPRDKWAANYITISHDEDTVDIYFTTFKFQPTRTVGMEFKRDGQSGSWIFSHVWETMRGKPQLGDGPSFSEDIRKTAAELDDSEMRFPPKHPQLDSDSKSDPSTHRPIWSLVQAAVIAIVLWPAASLVVSGVGLVWSLFLMVKTADGYVSNFRRGKGVFGSLFQASFTTADYRQNPAQIPLSILAEEKFQARIEDSIQWLQARPGFFFSLAAGLLGVFGTGPLGDLLTVLVIEPFMALTSPLWLTRDLFLPKVSQNIEQALSTVAQAIPLTFPRTSSNAGQAALRSHVGTTQPLDTMRWILSAA